MSTPLNGLRVFIASPGGLEAERRAFRDVLQRCNEDDAHFRGVTFIPIGWEATLGGVGRPQELINKDLEQCDYFVLVLHERWGSPTGNGEFSSGCEEEYDLARQCLADDRNMGDFMVCFKAVDDSKLVDPGEQLKRVLDFRRELEDQKEIFFETFDDVQRFRDLLRSRLHKWLRDNEPPQSSGGDDVGPIKNPPRGGGLMESRPTAVSESSEIPEDRRSDGSLVSEAERLADEGELVDAEITFSRAIAGRSDPDALVRFGRFLYRVGRDRQAKAMFERALELHGVGEDQGWRVEAFIELGTIYRDDGAIKAAHRVYDEALSIARDQGLLALESRALRRLAWLLLSQGQTEDATRITEDALDLAEESKSDYEIAGALGTLGTVSQIAGDLDDAEVMLRKSMAICEKLDFKQGMAIQYANLGLVADQRGDEIEARRLWTLALGLYQKIGARPNVEKVQRLLDRLDGED